MPSLSAGNQIRGRALKRIVFRRRLAGEPMKRGHRETRLRAPSPGLRERKRQRDPSRRLKRTREGEKKPLVSGGKSRDGRNSARRLPRQRRGCARERRGVTPPPSQISPPPLPQVSPWRPRVSPFLGERDSRPLGQKGPSQDRGRAHVRFN